MAFITAFLTGCGGGSSSTPTSPSISTTTVADATTGTAYSASITATGGTAPYTWSLSSGTLPAGLTLSTSTTSSVTITGTPTSAQQGAAFTIQVKDSAAKTATKAFTMNVVSTVSVAIVNKLAGILPGAAAVTFTALVQNDTAHQGVTWTLKANNGADCSPTCGTLTGAAATTVIYTPPATIPASPNNSVKITATSVADTTKADTDILSITNSPLSACTGFGNDAVLHGQYAFLIQGATAAGTSHLIGSFTANGAGKITAGEIDINGAAVSHTSLDTTATSYSVGADNRGCMTLVAGANSTVVHFALGGVTSNVATKGRLIQFDDSVGTGTRGAGVLLKQDTASVATDLGSGNYAFNLVGSNSLAARYAAAGAVTITGLSLSNGEIDADEAGTATHATPAAGAQSGTVTANGRGTFTLTSTLVFPINFVFYRVSSSEVLVASTDAISVTAPVVSGELRLQSGTFTNATLNGVSVLHVAGMSTSRTAAIGTFTTDGAGHVTAAIYNQDGATVNAVQNTTTTYTVAANGRTTLAAAGTPVLYLTGTNAGFVGANDPNGSTGELEAQTGGPFTTASLTGTYFFGTEAVGSNAAGSEVGVATPDGSGNAAVTFDLNSTTVNAALSIDNNTTSTYTVDTAGKASIGGNTAFLVSPNKVVILDGGTVNANPNIVVLEK